MTLEKLDYDHYRSVSRSSAMRQDAHDACTLKSRSRDLSSTIQTSYAGGEVLLDIQDEGSSIRRFRIAAAVGTWRPCPDDEDEARLWACSTAAEIISVLLGALEWANLAKNEAAPVDMSIVANRVGAVLRFREKHTSPLSRLSLRSPWEPAAFGEQEDLRPLPEDAECHLSQTIPPAVAIDRRSTRGNLLSIARATYAVGMFDIDDPVTVMREMATWTRP